MSLGFYSKKTTIVFLFLSAFIVQASLAQGYGTIKGTVYDKTSREELPAANILVRGTSLGTTTDLDGTFTLRYVPSGTQAFVVSYIGYVSSTVTVEIPDGGEVKQDFFLTVTTLEGQEVIVTAQAQGQMQAINQQLTSNKISNIVSEARIQELPDFNAAAAISRLPGVSALYSSGEANKIVIRGLDPKFNQVTIGGVRLASTGSAQIGVSSQGGTALTPNNDRSVDIASISPYMMKSISVYKSLTPDLYANAIGGVVNMELREAPSEFHSDLLWQSGYTAKSQNYGNYRGVGSMSARFFDDQLGVYVLGNLESYDRNADNMGAGYQIAENVVGANGYYPVQVTNITLNRRLETRKRYGGNAIFDYRLPSGSIKFTNMYTRLNSNFQEYRTIYNYTTGDLGFRFNGGSNSVDLATNSLGLTNDFGFLSIDLKVVNRYSRNYLPEAPQFQFTQTSGVGKSTKNTRPEDLAYLLQYGGDSAFYLYDVSLLSSDYKENGQVYKSDFKMPFNVGLDFTGYFKFGGEFQYSQNKNAQNTPYVDLRGGLTGTGVQANIMRGLQEQYPQLQDGYSSSQQRFYAYNFRSSNSKILNPFLDNRFGSILWSPNSDLLLDLTRFIASTPQYSGDSSTAVNPGGWFSGYFQKLPNNYKYIERYYASYTMAELNYGDLMVVGGVRYEMQKTLYEAYNLADGRDQKSQRYFPITSYKGNEFWLPMVQTKYNAADWFDVRYAYTQTLARPDYSQLSPHYVITYSKNRVIAGNPDLSPAHAYNHDLIFTFHGSELGLFSVGGFYKEIKDFTYATEYALFSSPPAGFYSDTSFNIGGVVPLPNGGATLSTYVNSRYIAYVKGIEVDLQTRFWYLPSPFNNMVLGINYTGIISKATYPWLDKRTDFSVRPARVYLFDSTRTGRLVNQPNNIVNAYIGYDYEGFSVRLSVIYTQNAVNNVANFTEGDGFTRDYFRVDGTIRQTLPWLGLEVYLDMNNFNNRNNASAQKTIGAFTSEQNYGFTANLGLRYRL